MKYSFVIPVYNRPDEVRELLESVLGLEEVEGAAIEVVIVEDGSSVPCRDVVEALRARFEEASGATLLYIYKENGGPGPARNRGVEEASGDYVVILDSDVVLPPHYLRALDESVHATGADAFGGPDRAHESFSPMQKAINYAMTSPLTTGGIRGRKGAKLDKFYPRSFNLGVRRDVFLELGGFAPMRFGEDIDFSTRLFEQGKQVRLFANAWVWHKRRVDLRKFYRQVYGSGVARIHLTRRHPGTLKLVHLLPTLFTVGVYSLLVLAVVAAGLGCPHWWVMLCPHLLFVVCIFAHASFSERSVRIGWRAVCASACQLLGYGTGLLHAWWHECVCGREELVPFQKTFYK